MPVTPVKAKTKTIHFSSDPEVFLYDGNYVIDKIDVRDPKYPEVFSTWCLEGALVEPDGDGFVAFWSNWKHYIAVC